MNTDSTDPHFNFVFLTTGTYTTSDGNRNTAGWEYGLQQQTAGGGATDRFFIGRSGGGVDFSINRAGQVIIPYASSTALSASSICISTDCRQAWPSGGSGGGTWSTTTSQVAGQLINYPNNATDIVVIGSTATTTGEFWFDPNEEKAQFVGANAANLHLVDLADAGTLGKIRFCGGTNCAFGDPSYRALISARNDLNSGNSILFSLGSQEVEALRIASTTAAGAKPRIGIGTTTPRSMLHIENTYPAITLYDDDGVMSDTRPAWTMVASGSSFRITSIGAYGADAAAGIDGFDTPRFVINSSGNVGVGTTSPYAKLSVHANNGDTNTTLFTVASSTASATTTHFVVNNQGRVGIGTTTFSYPDQFISSSRLTVQSSGSSGYVNIGGDITFDGGDDAVFWLLNTASTTEGSTRFVAYNGGAYNDVMTIKNNGNIGISTTTPWGKLSVHGLTNDTNLLQPLFVVASSTPSATSTLFSVDRTGLTTVGNSAGTGDAVFQIAGDTNAWSLGYLSSSKAFRIASSTNLTANVALQIAKGGTTTLSSGITDSNSGQYVCINTSTFEVTRNNTACSASSARFKENITDLSYGLDEVMRLRPVTFNFKPELNIGTSTYVGFIAEEVDLVVPELVSHGKDGLATGVDYPNMTALLARGIQEVYLDLSTIASTTASSTPASQAFAEAFFENVFARMRGWLADAGNSIGDLFATSIHVESAYAEKLCLSDETGETCITKAELDALLAGAAGSGGGPSGGGNTGGGQGGGTGSSGSGTSTDSGSETATSTDSVGDTDSTGSPQATTTPPEPPADTTPPEITLIGAASVTVAEGDTYADEGATATDDVDGDITSQIVTVDPVDTSTPGTYEVTYNVSDSAGNAAAEVVRTVTVEAAEPATEPEPEPTI